MVQTVLRIQRSWVLSQGHAQINFFGQKKKHFSTGALKCLNRVGLVVEDRGFESWFCNGKMILKIYIYTNFMMKINYEIRGLDEYLY